MFPLVHGPLYQTPGAATVGNRASRTVLSGWQIWLIVWTFLTLATAPIEGYLQFVNSNASKVPSAVLCLSWLVELVRRRRMPHLHRISWMAMALSLVITLSAAANPENTSATLYVERWLPFLILLVALIDILSTVCPLRVAVYGAVTGGVVSAIGSLFSFLVLGDARASGPLSDPNDLAYVLIATLPFVTLIEVKHRVLRAAALSAALLILLAGAATLSRGAAVALAALVVWALVRRIFPWKGFAVVLLLLSISTVVVLKESDSSINRAVDQKAFVAEANINTRELRWIAAGSMIGGHWLTGVGPGGFGEQYVSASGDAEIALQPPTVTHNMYLEVAAELGLLGFALFLGMIIAAVVGTEKVKGESHRGIAVAVQASLVGLLVASFFLSEEYYMALWAALALAGAMEVRWRLGQDEQ
jgi:putative inorganic carbon (HCO3(-)) transporter